MKKAILLILCLVFIFSVSQAEPRDYSSMSIFELNDEYNAIRNELARRLATANKDSVLIDQDGITVTLTGTYSIEEFGDEKLLYLDAIIINNTDKNITVDPSASINGWDVNRYMSLSASAGHKSKGQLQYNLTDANISTYEEITDIEFRFDVFDNDEFTQIISPDPVTVLYNQQQ